MGLVEQANAMRLFAGQCGALCVRPADFTFEFVASVIYPLQCEPLHRAAWHQSFSAHSAYPIGGFQLNFWADLIPIFEVFHQEMSSQFIQTTNLKSLK